MKIHVLFAVLCFSSTVHAEIPSLKNAGASAVPSTKNQLAHPVGDETWILTRTLFPKIPATKPATLEEMLNLIANLSKQDAVPGVQMPAGLGNNQQKVQEPDFTSQKFQPSNTRQPVFTPPNQGLSSGLPRFPGQ